MKGVKKMPRVPAEDLQKHVEPAGVMCHYKKNTQQQSCLWKDKMEETALQNKKQLQKTNKTWTMKQ